MNPKLRELLKRQTALVGKVAKGDANDQEKRELDALNKKIEELSNPEAVDVGKTTLATMTVAEFKKHVQEETVDATEKLDTKRLALLKRNIDSVKSQNKSTDEEVVAVEVLVDAGKSDERLDAMELKLDEIFQFVKGQNFDGRGTTGLVNGDAGGDAGTGTGEGEGEGEGEGTPSEKNDEMPVSTAAALEALTAMIARYEKVKGMVEGGDAFTSEELYKMWPGWELREAVEQSVEVLAKLEALKALMEAVNPELEKIAKEKEGEGEGEGEGVNKGDVKISKWLAGDDLASEPTDVKSQFGACKKHMLLDL